LGKLNDLREQASAEQIPAVTVALIEHDAATLRQQSRDLQYEALLMGLVARQ
jgi:hypothetical protein